MRRLATLARTTLSSISSSNPSAGAAAAATAAAQNIIPAFSSATPPSGPAPTTTTSSQTFPTTNQSRGNSSTASKPPSSRVAIPLTFSPLNPGNPADDTSFYTPDASDYPASSADLALAASGYPSGSAPLSSSSSDASPHLRLPDNLVIPSIKVFNPIAYDIDTSALLFDDNDAAPRAATTTTMSSDADYEAFLGKVQSDAASTPVQQQQTATATFADAPIPPQLHAAVSDRFYASDADEPFTPVALRVDSFSAAAIHKRVGAGSVKESSRADVDPRGQYADVFDAVKDAAGAGATPRFFEQSDKGHRAWLWILAQKEQAAGKVVLLGVRVLSVVDE